MFWGECTCGWAQFEYEEGEFQPSITGQINTLNWHFIFNMKIESVYVF